MMELAMISTKSIVDVGRKVGLVGLLLALGCQEPVVVGNTPSPNAPTTPAAAEEAPAEEAEAVEAETPDAGLVYTDEDFVELEADNRDPFRAFQDAFRQRDNTPGPQYRVTMPTTSIDEMRLIALITGTGQPRAMLLDQVGVGHVVRNGDYIGRSEVIQTGGNDSMPVRLNWRVERIRRGEIVLARRDPTDPDRPPLTRSIPLYDEGEDFSRVAERTRARAMAEQPQVIPQLNNETAPAGPGPRSL